MKKSTKIVDNKKGPPFPIVAIGASAGGLEAVTGLLKNIPAKTGMAYVYIQHLDPTHESMLVNILAKVTRLKVVEAKHLLKIKTDHLYIIPPDKGMGLIDGVLKLTPRQQKPRINMPIDQFFAALAEHEKEKAIGIVLSGTANDGTAGLRAIKMAGGLTFAQDDTARFKSMPRSAVAEGVVDFILSPANIAREIARISAHPLLKRLTEPENKEENANDIKESDLKTIITLLSRFSGIDFSHYKISTVRRRIVRRMVLHKKQTLKDYAKLLVDKEDELKALYQDLLINVTSFFRDATTHEYLRATVLPRLLKNKPHGEPIRIWVPACATGEEAYSLAITVCETLGSKINSTPVQIFATDVSEKAILKARRGEYSRESVEALSPKRVQRFFTRVNGNYRITKGIREMVVFAPHNIFREPPFSRIDIVSCCNLFIYLDNLLQKKALAVFHYALTDGGYLILGQSETISANAKLFVQANKKFRIYSRKKISDQSPFDPSYQLSHIYRDKMKDVNAQTKTPVINHIETGNENDLDNAVEDVLLKQYTPASVVVNNSLEILQFRGSTGLYMHPNPGKASLNLLKMTQASLGIELRNAVHKAGKLKQTVIKSGLEINNNKLNLVVDIEVAPLKGQWDEPLFLVLFKETSHKEVYGKTPNENSASAKDQKIKKLTDELYLMREDMRSIIEGQETANEELQSASEEIISSNEELQSINEELETSKEELESTNEELISTNQELQNRNEQLSESHSYTESIVSTIHESLVILDKELRVKSANKSFYKVFKVKEEETEGRSIFELGKGQWDIPELRELLLDIIIKNSSFFDFEVHHTFPIIGDKTMLLNAQRIVQKNDNEYSILLAIEDMTAHAKRVLKEKEAWFVDVADTAPVMLWLTGTDKQATFFNKTWLEFTGRAIKQEMGSGWTESIYKDDLDNTFKTFTNAFNARKPFYMEYRLRRNDGEYRWISVSGKPRHSMTGEFIGYIGSCLDIHDRKMMNDELEKRIKERTAELLESNINLNRSNNELQQFAYVASHDLQEPLRKILTYSDRLQKKFANELTGDGLDYVSRIAASSHRMSRLIQDILNFSRATNNSKGYEKVNLTKIAQEVMDDFDEIMRQKKAKVTMQKLPVVNAIPLQMTQLFHNLISNALKFNREKGTPTVQISAHGFLKEKIKNYPALDENKKYCEIIVKDNGIGFNEQFADKIFTIFQRLEEKSKYPGNGIGLALCKKIVDNHGGIIFAQSSEGKGTAFHVVLPVQAEVK